MSAEDELINGLDEVVVKLLCLLLLLWPVRDTSLSIWAVHILVVLDQGLDRLWCELVGDFVAQDHIDVNDIGLEMNHLVVIKGFAQRVFILDQLRVGRLGQQQRG